MKMGILLSKLVREASEKKSQIAPNRKFANFQRANLPEASGSIKGNMSDLPG